MCSTWYRSLGLHLTLFTFTGHLICSSGKVRHIKPHAGLNSFRDCMSTSNQGGAGAVKGDRAMSTVLCTYTTNRSFRGLRVSAKGESSCMGIEFYLYCGVLKHVRCFETCQA